MSDIGKFPPGHGHAWRGDWRQRLSELLQTRGFTSVSQFADVHPLRSLVQLADDLGGGDVAAVQLETVLLDEARSTGTTERRARDLLARRLATLSGGWPGPAAGRTREQESQVMAALSGWVPKTLPGLTTAHIVAIGVALLRSTELPAGWRPTGPDDPVIVEVFERYWPTDETS
jgi:hypothetical protein